MAGLEGRRRWVPLMIAATVALAVGMTSMLPTTSGPLASLAVLPPVDEDASMYDCKVETSVSKEFSTGDWGTLTGDWYAIVRNGHGRRVHNRKPGQGLSNFTGEDPGEDEVKTDFRGAFTSYFFIFLHIWPCAVVPGAGSVPRCPLDASEALPRCPLDATRH